MRVRIVLVSAATIILAWSVQFAHAGAIRSAAKALHQGSVATVQKTPDAAVMASGSVENAGKTARAALKNGTLTLRIGAASAPGMAVQETKAAASRIWKAVW
jgi:hypothetical protein